MRKNALALGVAAALMGVAGTASAGIVANAGETRAGVVPAQFLTAAQNGMGHINIIPYYTSQAGFYSTINIVNTDTLNGKALKVRFRSAINSDDVFDFQVLMSPGDMWTAAVTEGADGRSKLITRDNTCTQPAMLNDQSFITSRLPRDYTDAAKAQMTREGYVEILTMADIPDRGPAYTANSGALYKAIKHGSKGVPTCAVEPLDAINHPAETLSNTLLTSTTLSDYRSGGLDFPTQGIFTNWTSVNVPSTSSYSGEAEALVAIAQVGDVRFPGSGNLVFFPQNGSDVSAIANTFTADPLLRTPTGTNPPTYWDGMNYANAGFNAVTALSVDGPDLSTPYTPSAAGDPIKQATDLTQSIATRSVSNEFYVNPGLAAATDMTFSMPTRRYHVVMDYDRASRAVTTGSYKTDGRLFSRPAGPSAASDPFNYFFTARNTTVNGFEICTSSMGFTFRDREEQSVKEGGIIISPAQPTAGYRLCGETNVLVINGVEQNTFVLGANQATTRMTTTFTAGWLSINTANEGAGLPVLGSTFMKLNNSNATPGISGNYGLVHTHRYDRTHY